MNKIDIHYLLILEYLKYECEKIGHENFDASKYHALRNIWFFNANYQYHREKNLFDGTNHSMH